MKKNKKSNQKTEQAVEKYISFYGEVVDCRAGDKFEIRLENSGEETKTILAILSGKLRQNKIRVLLGDRVRIEVSPFDLSHGRIAWRAD